MNGKRILSVLIAVALLLTGVLSVSAAQDDVQIYSEEYKSSPYYTQLKNAQEESKDASAMERVLAVALSQEGYKNYATEGVDLEQARAEGKLWTGAELRMNNNKTGNTEYTRWAQRYVANSPEAEQYFDFDWCAIFVSWCMYQAGYYDDAILKKYFYSFSADPRIFYDADSWIGSYNLDQKKVYYAPSVHHKLDSMPWNTYYHVDVDPLEMPYKPGGLIFFTWDGSGKWFNHVAIVVSYDPETCVLTYTNGNCDGQVITCRIDLDATEDFRGKGMIQNSDRIGAYAEYDKYVAPEQKEIHTESQEISWDVHSDAGLSIKTDSASILASVSFDGQYHGSIIDSNMIFHEGLLTIGKSELNALAVGDHQMKLTFDDGELELTLHVTDTQHMPNGFIGDVDSDATVTILDATAIQRYLANLTPLTCEQLAMADVDADDDVTIIDATKIQRFIAGMDEVMG